MAAEEKKKEEEKPQKGPPASRPAPLVHDPDDRLGPLWMGVGLIFLGVTVGFITGLSFAPGISQSLVTSVFTFVGGALLTYGGFVRAQRTAATGLLLRTSRVGFSLCCFSIGIIGGVKWGMHERLTGAMALLEQMKPLPAGNDAKPEQGTPPAQQSKQQVNLLPFAVLHTESVSRCLRILSPKDPSYSGEQGREQALDDLKWVREHLECSATGPGFKP